MYLHDQVKQDNMTTIPNQATNPFRGLESWTILVYGGRTHIKMCQRGLCTPPHYLSQYFNILTVHLK